jgi:hypothetical protein
LFPQGPFVGFTALEFGQMAVHLGQETRPIRNSPKFELSVYYKT